MTSQLPRFLLLFFMLAAEKNTLKNGVAVMSLRSYLFRDTTVVKALKALGFPHDDFQQVSTVPLKK